jgi:UDP-sulfoquinovose synthase
VSEGARLDALAAREWPAAGAGRVNLNPGTLGAPSLRVRAAMRAACEDEDRHAWPLGMYALGRSELAGARALAHALWGGPAPAVAGGTTALVNLLVLRLAAEAAAAGRPLRVLTTGHEHEGGISGFEAHPAFAVAYAPDAAMHDVERFADEARRMAPDVVFLSQVTWTDGRILDVAALLDVARAVAPEAWCIVDAAQVVGNGRPSFAGDLTVASAHKWLGGPAGTGFAWAGARAREALAWSWTGHALDPESPEARFEAMGGQDFARFAGVRSALALHAEAGVEAAVARSAERARTLALGLQACFARHGIAHAWMDPFTGAWGNEVPPRLAGVCAVQFAEWDPYPAYAALDARGVHLKCVKGRTPTGALLQQWRLGVPWHTPEEDLARALARVEDVLRGR